MASTSLEYVFSSPHVANTDGTFGFDVPATAIIDSGMNGPVGGVTYPKALNLFPNLSTSVNIGQLKLTDTFRFHVRAVFRVDSGFTGEMVIVESDKLPFKLALVGQLAQVSTIHITATLNSSTNGPRVTDTIGTPLVTTGFWHVADLVWDVDTLAMLLDGQVYSIHGFGPENKILLNSSPNAVLRIGKGSAPSSQFTGLLAEIKLESGAPVDLETLIDDRRTSPQWFITTKLDTLKPKLNMGQPTTTTSYLAAIHSWSQQFSIGGAIMYNSSSSTAFQIFGSIWRRYQAMTNRNVLGFLITDEVKAANQVGRKSLFQKGGMYWSSSTGAWEVLGQVYLDYENTGESSQWGFPIEAPQNIAGGTSQRMQQTTWYMKNGASSAHEVHGQILSQFVATGGTGVWGFPIINETVLTVKNSPQAGKNVRLSDFELCSFYWSAATGAHEVHGDIREKWRSIGGPSSPLGLPLTNEMAIPGSNGRMSGFEGGVICWYGNFDSIKVVRPFQLFIGSINTQNSEGFGMGGNDIYFNAVIVQDGVTTFRQKYPSSGDFGGSDAIDPNITLPPVITPSALGSVTFTLDVWDSDSGAPFGGGDDHLGTWVKKLDGSNAWGMLEHEGVFNSGSMDLINNIQASIKPQVDIKSLSWEEKWWGLTNKGTDPLTYAQYEEAFSDVGHTADWWNLGDDLKALYFEAVVKHIAKNGNCFGLSLEAIFSLKGASVDTEPLNRFMDSDWEAIRNSFNVRHAYQMGAAPIWWFASQFASGKTHDPVYVFNQTRDAFSRGDNPVLCLSQNWDFSGAPHCVLPVGWDSSTPKSWKLDLMDPNFPKNVRTLFIDSTTNSYRYDGKSSYTGTSSSGGRLYYMPFDILSGPQRTPLWEAIMLLLTASIIILGSDAKSSTIQDSRGNDLSAQGQRATDLAKRGGHLEGFYTPAPVTDGIIPGAFLITKGATPTFEILPPGTGLSSIEGILRRNPQIVLHPLINIGDLETILLPALGTMGDFSHTITGTRNGGRLSYLTKTAFTHFETSGTIDSSESVTVTATAVSTANAKFSVKVNRRRKLIFQITQLISGSGNFVRLRTSVELENAGTVHMAPRPGLGIVDLELEGSKSVGAFSVQVSTMTDGKLVGHASEVSQQVSSSGGLRFKISPSLSEHTVAVSGITRIGTPLMTSSQLLRPLPTLSERPLLSATIAELRNLTAEPGV